MVNFVILVFEFVIFVVFTFIRDVTSACCAVAWANFPLRVAICEVSVIAVGPVAETANNSAYKAIIWVLIFIIYPSNRVRFNWFCCKSAVYLFNAAYSRFLLFSAVFRRPCYFCL